MHHPQHEHAVYQAVLDGELEIDHCGRIWRLKKRTYDRWTGGTKTTSCKRVRAEIMNGAGYLQVRMMRDCIRIGAAAHRLVWRHFRGPIPDGITINHKNGVKSQNEPDNLEQATYSEQRLHAIRVLGAKHADVRGEKHPKAQVTSEQVLDIRRRRRSGERIKDIAEVFGMRPKAVSSICCNRTWRHLSDGTESGA
jgi:hypothetical protein